jgi:hypothetical protein
MTGSCAVLKNDEFKSKTKTFDDDIYHGQKEKDSTKIKLIVPIFFHNVKKEWEEINFHLPILTYLKIGSLDFVGPQAALHFLYLVFDNILQK